MKIEHTVGQCNEVNISGFRTMLKNEHDEQNTIQQNRNERSAARRSKGHRDDIQLRRLYKTNNFLGED